MSMPSLSFHFLNVNDGDCSIIKHGTSGHVSVIDVCNARKVTTQRVASEMLKAVTDARTKEGGNYWQKANPDNPIEYLKKFGEQSVFRFALTHPDMDHMDGIKDFFVAFDPTNFYDTNNTKTMGSFQGSPYRQEDWQFYQNMRDTKPQSNPKRITLYSGDNGIYRAKDWNGTPPGDAFYTLAPTPHLIEQANANPKTDYHDASYVFLYQAAGGRILLPGDAFDATWEHVIATWKDRIEDIDLLIAPHHGRDSGRSYDFLTTLKPKMTFFGNAPGEHLAYPAWRQRNLEYITNNQAGSMVVDCGGKNLTVYVTNKTFARDRNPNTFFSQEYQAWYLQEVR